MKGTQLGEFEELVLLAVGILYDNAYAVSIYDELQAQTGRKIILSSVHKSLLRLEEKGYLKSAMGSATAERGGRAKKLYQLTKSGAKALTQTRDLRNAMWQNISQELMLKVLS